MKKSGILLLISMFIAALVGCSNQSNNQAVGTVTGAVAGGLIGSTIGAGTGQAVAIGVGIVAGALLGNEIGKHMDSTDTAKVNDTMDNNVTSQPAYWVNPKTGGKYMMVPESGVFHYKGFSVCRRYASTAYVNGMKRHMHGIACKQSNGMWVLVTSR